MIEPVPQAESTLLNTRFVFEFPKFIDKANFNSSQIQITDLAGNTYPVGNNYSIQNMLATHIGILKFKPEKELPPKTAIQIKIESLVSVVQGVNMSARGSITTIDQIGPHLIFLDTALHARNLGGTANADVMCNNSADRPADDDLPNGLRRVYMLLAGTDPDFDDEIPNPRHLCGAVEIDDDDVVVPGACGGVNLVNWPIYNNTPYFKRTGAQDQLIATTEENLEAFNADLEVPIANINNLNAITGLDVDFRSSGMDCNGWTLAERGGMTVGNPASLILGEVMDIGVENCATPTARICISIGVN